MARSVREIALEIREAVSVIRQTNAQLAEAVSGTRPEGTPRIDVRLDDGRTVELGALADELVEAADRVG